MKHPWLKLIEEWQDNIHFGLSVPFFVGALREWPNHPLGEGTTGAEQLHSLFSSIRDCTEEEIVMRLYHCEKLGDLALAKINGIPQYCTAIPSSGSSEATLYIENSLMAECGNTFEGLINTMSQRYRNQIDAGHFSRKAGIYHPFDENDRELILAAIARANDV